MSRPHVVIIGGGLAGLSAGCYALRNGYRTTIVEHNLALGGVCTAWNRGPYVIDGCIHWLTGGPFTALYDELDITSHVKLRPLDVWQTYRNVEKGLSIPITRDLDALFAELSRVSPVDAPELERVRRGASKLLAMSPERDVPELIPWRERLRPLWEMRGALGSLLHFRKTIGEWTEGHLSSPVLRRLFTSLVPEAAPAFFLLMMLGVAGPTATDSYFERPQATALAKIRETLPDGRTRIVHRMGDVGYVDGEGRLWFCGRKSHRVETADGPRYTEQVEPIFNTHAAVRRSALVGVGKQGEQIPVLCIERQPQSPLSDDQLRTELRSLPQQFAHTRCLQHILFHPGFPDDIRHNAKIGRDILAAWAARQVIAPH